MMSLWSFQMLRGAEIARLTSAAVAAFDGAKLAANVDALLAIRAKLAEYEVQLAKLNAL